MKNKLLFLLAILSSCGFSWPFFSHPNPEPFGTYAWLSKQEEILHSAANNLDARVLHLSLLAYMKARREGLDHKEVLTVIDYTLPSTEKRLWVFDLHNGKTLFNTWVAHGKNSGDLNSTSFSNSEGSLKSSLGVFMTEHSYVGRDGYSLRLRGLERGVNDNAYNRAVVVHGAPYVNPDTIRRYGEIGRSWGCPAVSEALAKPIIDTIKENTLIFAYYPDRHWLSHSPFLSA